MSGFLIIAHGSPSNPAPAELALAAIAAQVAALRPQDQILSATLAKPGALAQAIETMPRARIYPFFMAQGWFTSRQLPRRLADLGSTAPILSPFGSDPALSDLVVRRLAATASETVILCAHGSQASRASSRATVAMVEKIAPQLKDRQIVTAFLEEDPHLRDVARRFPKATVLPFFALRAGHVEQDIPAALQEANFCGQLLPPIGADPEIPALIAAALGRLS